MSFCRITGRCRSLPKPNYFPLLPPISPADAKRFCRITGKSHGLSSHHFIPVLLVTSTRKQKCKITNISGELGVHHYIPDSTYGRKKHIVICEFRYVLPVLDESDETHKILMDVLRAKTKPIENELYVYKVQERNFGLVFPANLEAAVRDGDVRDVMLAKDSDKLMLKLKKGKSISVDLKNIKETELNELYDGEGPREEVQIKREKEEKKMKEKAKPKGSLSTIATIFEQKEKKYDVELENEQKIKEEAREKVEKLAREKLEKRQAEKVQALKLSENFLHQESELSDLVKPLIESWDWDTLEKESAANNTARHMKSMPETYQISSINVSPVIKEVNKSILEKSVGLEAASYVGIISPLPVVSHSAEHFVALNAIDRNVLDNLTNIESKLTENVSILPQIEDIQTIIKQMQDGVVAEVENVPGLKMNVNEREVFIPGPMLFVSESNEFIPGQTFVSDENGELEFVPGLMLNTQDGIQFLPGEISYQPETKETNFVAGKRIDDKFVCGQILSINDEPQFVQGQTIITPDGLKFVAGIIDEETNSFIPGQNIVTPDGIKFVPGQTVTVNNKEKFIPGQNVLNKNNEWVFVPGQSIVDESGVEKFVAGKTIVTNEGAKFVPGQYVDDVFVPGISDGKDFVPGLNIETKEGSKFVQGQIVITKHGEVFMPGTTIISDSGEILFTIASTIDSVKFSEATPIGMVVDSENMMITEPLLSVFGNMVQNDKGVEFYPEKISKSNLPPGKIVPGKLIKQHAETKFIPGIIVDDGFIPGQVVLTDQGEQFVPGQVIETSEGLKFVPGQIIETKSGMKFVPGQTMQTLNGPRFVPGQIINTKAGPTFIPGQVICTEDDGERFVPGQVVDTEDGPRFVPGRVVETENKVTFIPGHIVQTADGPRFVAPDLKDNDEGDQEFSVQSFIVSPEELKLLKPTQNSSNIDGSHCEIILSVDSSMLQQLSEAGMHIGRQVEASAVDFVLQSTKEKQALRQFIADSSFGNGNIEAFENIFENLKNICSRVDTESCHFPSADEFSFDVEACNGSIEVIDVLAASLASVLGSSDAIQSNKNMYEIISEALKSVGNQFSVEEIQHVMESSRTMEYLCGVVNKNIIKTNIDNKIQHLKNFVIQSDDAAQNGVEHGAMVDDFCKLLDNSTMTEAFVNMMKKDEKLFKNVLNTLKTADGIDVSANLSNILQAAVVESIQETANDEIKNMLTNFDSKAIKELLKKSECLAHALGLSKEAEKLEHLIRMPGGLENINNDPELFRIVNRMMIMEKLAENDTETQKLLQDLVKTPTLAGKSEKLRALIRQSGTLSYAPPKDPIVETSKDVPLSLFYSDNQIAIEEFLMKSGQRKYRGSFLIIKTGFQAVIPRESSHDVLTGKIAYTVLDEDGIRYFEPLNVLSALKMNARNYHKFSMYNCDIAEEADLDVSTASSSTDGDYDDIPYLKYPKRNKHSTNQSSVYMKRRKPKNGSNQSDALTKFQYFLPMQARIAIKASISRENPDCYKPQTRLHINRPIVRWK